MEDRSMIRGCCSIVVGVAAALLMFAAVPDAQAKPIVKCGVPSKCTNPDVVDRAFDDVNAQCACGAAPTAKAYKQCWKPVVKALVQELGKTGFPKACKVEVTKALNASLCGRPGYVLCRKVKGNGQESCQVVKEAKCAEPFPQENSACGAFTNCGEACNQDACTTTTTAPPTTSSTIATTTSTTLLTTTSTIVTTTSTIATTTSTIASTTTSTTTVDSTTSTTEPTSTTTTSSTTTTIDLCGNGTIDAGEECDTEDFGGATCPGSSVVGAFLECTPECTIDFSNCPGASTTSTSLPGSTTTSTSVPGSTSTSTTILVTTTSTTEPTSTSTTTVTSTTSTTTSTAPEPVALRFTTALAGGVCGESRDGGEAGTILNNLTCGGLNI